MDLRRPMQRNWIRLNHNLRTATEIYLKAGKLKMEVNVQAKSWPLSFDKGGGQSIFDHILLFYLASFVLEGPLRFLLATVELGSVLYIRDFLLLQAIILAVVSTQQGLSKKSAFVALVWIIAAHSVWAFYIQNGVLQFMLGLKVFLPVLFGAIVFPLIRLHSLFWKRVFNVFFTLSVLGVISNVWVKFPWEGMSYDIGGIVSVYTTRDWSAMGVERAEGFARSSFDAAIQIFLFAVVIVTSNARSVIKVIAWTLAGVAIFLTTTKGVLLAFVAVTIVLLADRFVGWKRQIRVVLLVIMALGSVSLPMLLPWLLDQRSIVLDGEQQVFVFSSFLSRVFDTWPNAFALIQEHGNFFLGRGVGGIGFPQLLTEPGLYSPADSLFVYLYATFGVFAFFYLALIIVKSIRLADWSEAESSFYFCVVFGLLVYGCTTNVVESAVYALFIGLLIGYVFRYPKPSAIDHQHARENPIIHSRTHFAGSTVSRLTAP